MMNSLIAGAVGAAVIAGIVLAIPPARTAEPAADNANWPYAFAYVLGAYEGLSKACKAAGMSSASKMVEESADTWQSIQTFFDSALAAGKDSVRNGGSEILSARQFAAALEAHDQISAHLAVKPCSGTNLILLSGSLRVISKALSATAEISRSTSQKLKIADLRGEGEDIRRTIVSDNARDTRLKLNDAAAEIVQNLRSINLVTD